MAKTHRKGRTERYFVVDGAYLKKEASEAVKTFAAPFSGLYQAVMAGSGTHSATNVREPTRQKKGE